MKELQQKAKQSPKGGDTHVTYKTSFYCLIVDRTWKIIRNKKGLWETNNFRTI